MSSSNATPSSPFLTRSASELARMIRDGEATSVEIVDAHIDHARRVNPDINAIVRDRFADAREEAERADHALATEDPDTLGPLHGVPCSIKESIALEGMPNTAGALARRDVVAERDAPSVRRLRDAGAIPLGVTNIPELCMWYESHNTLYGRTSNAYSPHHICGGSSGGEGAFIGAGGAPFGLGADVGGSIRLPAFFNGVFGHKPSIGLVPNSGQYPLMMDPNARLLSTGPLARRAEDLELLLRVLMGPDGVDPVCRERELGDPSEVDVSDLVVYVVPGLEILPPSQDMLEAQRKAAVMLERLGAEVREVSLPEFEKSFEIWGAMMSAADGPSFAELMGKPTTLSIMRELGRWGRRRSPHTLPALLLAVLEKANALIPQRNAEMVARGEALERELTSLLGERGVLLFPSFPTVAPRHVSAMLRPFHSMYTGLFNALAMPVTQTPLGLNRQGLPLGVQIVAPDGADHRAIAVGLALEDAFGGWVPPWHVV